MPAKLINKTKTEPTLQFKDLNAGDWFDYAGYVYMKIVPATNSMGDKLEAIEVSTNRAVKVNPNYSVKLLKNVEISYEE